MTIQINYENNHYDGVINYIKEKYPSSIHDYIFADCSSLVDADGRTVYGPLGIDDPDDKFSFHSQDIENSWYQVTLNYLLKPTSYSIESYYEQYPQSWTFSASSDGIHWDALQNKSKVDELSEIQNYPLDSSLYYSIFRFTMHDKRIGKKEDYYLEIFHFELFGFHKFKSNCSKIKDVDTPIKEFNILTFIFKLKR